MTTLWFVAQWALRSSGMIVAGTLLLRLFRVKDASIRLAVWVAMLCGSLAMPLLTAALPALPLLAARPAPVSQTVTIVPDAAPATTVLTASQPDASVPQRFDATQLAVIVYAIVAGALLLRLGVGVVLGMRLLRASRPTGRMMDGVEVRESDRVTVPVTLGIVRAAIVLPSEWRDWDATKLEAVLAHERSHVRRRDPMVQVVSAMHRALLWHTPLSWFLHRCIVRVAEEASDDAALAAVRDRASYAGILLDFMRGETRPVAWEGVSMARYGSPEQRIRRVLNGTAISRGVTLGSVVAIVTLVAPLAYVAAAAQPRQMSGTISTVAPIAEAATPAQEEAATRPVPSGPPAPARPATTSSKPARPATVMAQPAEPSSETQAATATSSNTQTSSGAVRRYIVVHGDSTSGSWDSDFVSPGELRARFGDNFAWFRQNGQDYVVTDAAVMAELDKAMEPQKNVNRMQAGVNAEQSRVNGLQSKVNAHQGDVNALQNEVNRRQDLVNQIQASVNREDNAALIQKLETELKELRAGKPEANQSGVNRKQSEVNQEQAGVNAEQSKVNAMQAKVNDEQHRVSAEFSRRAQEIFDSAVRSGAAKPVK